MSLCPLGAIEANELKDFYINYIAPCLIERDDPVWVLLGVPPTYSAIKISPKIAKEILGLYNCRDNSVAKTFIEVG